MRYIKLVATLLYVFLAVSAHPQMLLRRDLAQQPEESCNEHIALTRHWFKDAARASPVKWYARTLMRSYAELWSPEAIKLNCADIRSQKLYDVWVAEVRLQMAYDMYDAAELKRYKANQR